MTRKVLFSMLFFLLAFSLNAQQNKGDDRSMGVLKGGIRIQKAQKLYWENGIAVDYTHPKLWEQRIHVGASYVTSRLGSAMGTNAVKQDNYLVNASINFRHEKQLQPFVRLNAGYFKADYGDPVFDVLPSSSLLLSLDAGVSYELPIPVTMNVSAGYNLISGTGSSGPGTLFPFYYQLSIYYTIFK